MRSVWMRPGATTLTRMLSGPILASVLASPQMPVRSVLEVTSPGTGCLIDDEAMVRMRPPPAFFNSGTAACTSRI